MAAYPNVAVGHNSLYVARQERFGDRLMNRQQWKDVLEAIGFLAIIGSLYFVGVETQNSAKQTALNTQAVEIAGYQELIANISNINAIGIQNKDAAAILLEMRDGDPDGVDRFRLQSAFYNQFRHGDMAYFMYERGVIDEDRLRSTLRPLPLVITRYKTIHSSNANDELEH